MAEGKKSFVLYTDLIHTVEKLPSDKAGELFKHLLRYVNDLGPVTTDLIVEVTFEPIKQQLKRDLQKWEDNSVTRSEIGRLGGLKSAEARRSKSKQNEPIGSTVKQNQANQPVSVSVSVNDTVKTKEVNIPDYADFFTYAKSLPIYKPTLDYSITAKYNDWVSNGWKDGHDKKITNWKTKLQNTLPYLKHVEQTNNKTPKGMA